nr:sodium:solute symporter [Propionibacteriales bacterium]
LYTRWFHRWALIAGWAAGMAVGFWATYQIPQKQFNEDGSITIVKEHFGSSGLPLSELGFDSTTSIYAGLVALLANLVVCALGTVIFRALKVPEGQDVTKTSEYFADQDDPRLRDLEEIVH